jgi:tetratricopeptide (TPR) repeat protein
MTDVLDALPVVPLGATDWGQAARVLEQALKAGNQDLSAAYLLAMCYKHLGRASDARQVLSKIAHPDANVLLQRGVLSFADRDFAQAGHEFTRSWEMEPTSYPAAYNLLLARLCQDQTDECVKLIPKIVALAPSPQEQRFLSLLGTLLSVEQTPDANKHEREYLLGSMSADEEARLVDILGGLGSFEVVYPLLMQLVAMRPGSDVAYGAYFGAALVQGKLLMERFQWEEAYSLLAALARRLEGGTSKVDNMALIALNGMLGTCSCMLQDFERGAWYFRTTQEIFHKEQMSGKRAERHINSQGVYQGAWIEQNLALAYEWQGKLDKAEQHWSRYFDYLEHYFQSSRPSDFLPKLAFEGLSRLADLFTKKEKWTTALGFLQRAHRVRPTDSDTLERLFHLYTQLKKPDEAKRILRRLREVRPNDPQVELFEMDVRDVRAPDDIEKTIADIRRILQKHPGDMRVEERAGAMINNLVPSLERLGEQYTAQINKVIDQMRRLPSYQINWPVVRNVMRDLEDKFYQLRRAAQKCLSLLTNDDLRRDINSLVTHCDRKIDQCHSLGE